MSQIDLRAWPTPLSPEALVTYGTLDGEPVSKARARVVRTRNGRVHAYTPSTTRAAEQALGWLMRSHLATACDKPDHDAPQTAQFGVRAYFSCKTRRRRDIDNCLKVILDAANHVVWDDDIQVAEIQAWIDRGARQAFTSFAIYRIVSRIGILQEMPSTRAHGAEDDRERR